MNAELVPSEVATGASWSRPPLVEASGAVLGGWWEAALGRIGVGECARTPEVVARAFASTPDSVRGARALAAETAAEWGMRGVAEDLRLIISEFVGNSCRHAAPGRRSRLAAPVLVQLRLLALSHQVVCMVADTDERGPVRVDAHHFAESGRGLGLVSAFSSEWGWERIPGEGKVVWAICSSDA
ncbi:ATP-binding protein [Nocardiopsis sp. CNT312]|uniref:ATP-binding protein n=1 Tax=Nocardiopsis sp. CNT312 TaxID=1137268 RepID=UPI00048BAE3A|nr:ATP-binding protein [Nocardiopsis sp. CNT312]